MTSRLRNMLPGCLAAIAVIAVLSSPSPCEGQEGDANRSPTKAPSRSGDSTASGGQETEAGPADPGTTPGIPATGGGQTGVAGLTGRVRSLSRNGPTRESLITIDLGTKYARAVVGGFEQGAVLGLGVQFTTADLFRFVEFRATALTSPILYRRFEGEAYIPKVFVNRPMVISGSTT
jgi:hypothetical protein